MLVEAYFDESVTQVISPTVLTVAGYIFRSDQSRKFSRDATKDLCSLGLSHFHQTDCANKGGEYAKFDVAKCRRAQDLLRENIKRRTIMGVGTSINVDQYAEVFAGYDNAPTAYTYALTGCLNIVRRWIERTAYDGEIVYFFETGYGHRTDADKFMSEIIFSPTAISDYRYVSHTFADKKKMLPLQAADMLAWYTNQEFTRVVRGIEGRRKDFHALLRPQETRIDHNLKSLTEFRDILIDAGRI